MEEQAPRPPARVDHETLLAAAQRGTAAQREACRRILAQVYKVVAAVLGPRSADVGDVAQEAFLRAYNNLHKFAYDPERPAGPTAWVNKIALRTALDHRAGLPPWEQIDDSAPEREPHTGGDDMVDSLHRARLATALLEHLDERHRAILILHYWNGETQEEIAETLSIPLGTVKTRMRVAHQKIREHAKEQ
jgi:RNA polymerase sigma-70 factor, ECF subfamily